MGPTIVGYSSSDPRAILTEADQQQTVMNILLGLSADFWSTFLAVEEENIFMLKVPPPKKLNAHRYDNYPWRDTGYTTDKHIFNSPMASTRYPDIGNTPTGAIPLTK